MPTDGQRDRWFLCRICGLGFDLPDHGPRVCQPCRDAFPCRTLGIAIEELFATMDAEAEYLMVRAGSWLLEKLPWLRRLC